MVRASGETRRMRRMPRRRPVVVATCVSALVVALCLASANAAVNYPDFSSTSGLKLNGDAQKSGGVLRLTDATDQRGSAFTKHAVVKRKGSFKTHFVINQHDGNSPAADGMAFVVQSNKPGALGAGGGGLGYSGIGDSIVVEFDIYGNAEANDPSSNHVAVMKNGNSGNHLVDDDPGFSLYGNTVYVWVNYSAKSGKVKVFTATTDTKPGTPLLSTEVNLSKLLDANGYAGFTGATGGSDAVQDVLSWTLKSH
jgi:Legume lectin domain